jgi:trans-aconitate 2-methyltransferase
MTTMWDAALYLRFGGERARPFFDLLARVGAELPGYVVDMGCGPGNLTALLAERWPAAEVCGVDSSPEMIEAARRLVKETVPRLPAPAGAGPVTTSQAPGLSFMVDDIRHWEPQSLPDVVISNAVLQWVPGHRELLVRWADRLASDGWLAFQVPGNFDQPHARDHARAGGLGPVAPAAAGRGAEPAIGRPGGLRGAVVPGRL